MRETLQQTVRWANPIRSITKCSKERTWCFSSCHGECWCCVAWLSCVDRSSMAYEWFPACCWSMSRRVATRPLWSTCDCTCSEKFDSTIHRLWCGMVWPSPDDKMYQNVIIKVLMTSQNLTQSNIHVRFWRNVKHRLINGPQMRHRLKDGCTSCHLKPSTPFYTWSLCCPTCAASP